MNSRVLAGMMIVGTVFLGACTLANPRVRITRTVVPAVASAVVSPATVTATVSGAAPADTAITTVTDTATVTQTGAYIEPTPTEEITSTEEVTPTTVGTQTADVTPAVEVTPTIGADAGVGAQVTPTTPDAGQAADEQVVTTTVKVLVVRVRVLNIRNGPGLIYRVIGRYLYGRVVRVTAASADGTWYRVACANGREGNCWVSADPNYVTARK